MNLCCSTYINLGCVNSCEPLEVQAIASANGDYVIYVDFNHGLQKVEVSTIAGQPLLLDIPFNENYIYKIKVYLPNGTFEACYKFQTKLVKM